MLQMIKSVKELFFDIITVSLWIYAKLLRIFNELAVKMIKITFMLKMFTDYIPVLKLCTQLW